MTGAAGMLGREVSEVLAADGSTGVVLAARARLDVTDADAVRQALSALGPSGVVLNAAGWTNVDAAEAHENEAVVGVLPDSHHWTTGNPCSCGHSRAEAFRR